MKLIMTTLIVVCLALSSSGALAADASGIAVVDVKKIMNESSATKSIQKQIEAKKKSIQSEVTKQEENLRKKDEELAKQQSVLSKEAFEKKVQDFKNEVVNAQRDVQSKRTKLENAYSKAIGEVEAVVLSIISELSTKKGFLLAVPRSSTLFAKDTLDISSEVLKTLNERLPDVKVTMEK